MDARLDPRDQIELPRAPFDLPDAQRREADRPEQGKTQEQQPAQCAPISMASGGIMLALRWYMIHIEPTRTISTSTPVKI
jgi:hypothetical protein